LPDLKKKTEKKLKKTGTIKKKFAPLSALFTFID
jgi:hypothetical protein